MTSAAQNTSSAPATKKAYVPALDGLRALSVLAVIAYHMNFTWMRGGLIGVTVFFVLSGYLITSLLIKEFRKTGTIDLPAFWMRRVRRLFPAVVTTIVCVAALCTLFNHVLLTKMRPDIIPSLFFFNNWWQIFCDVSYFEALGSPSPLTHFWSLAIEEQFYLVWPVLLLFIFHRRIKIPTLRRVVFVLMVASVAAMALLYVPGGDPSRVYYGTDTRAFSLLIGAWFAFVWPSHPLSGLRPSQKLKVSRPVQNIVGWVSLVALLAFFVFADGYSDFPYYGGLFLASLVSALLICALIRPYTQVAKLLSVSPLIWIGKRSYGMYLWHYPIILLIPSVDGAVGLLLNVVELVLIFVISDWSFRFIEDPLRKGAIGKLVKSVRDGSVQLAAFLCAHAFPFIPYALVIALAIGGIAFVPEASAVEDADLYKGESAQVEGIDTETKKEVDLDLLFIGDSVALKCIDIFPDVFPHGGIDAKVSRQVIQGKRIYQSYIDDGVKTDVVVFALSNNASCKLSDVEALIDAVGTDKQIFFVNTRNEQDYEVRNNAVLQQATSDYDNVHLIDWYTASADHSEYFEQDGMHLKPAGAKAYLQVVYDAVKDYLPEHSEGEGTVSASSSLTKSQGTYLPDAE